MPMWYLPSTLLTQDEFSWNEVLFPKPAYAFQKHCSFQFPLQYIKVYLWEARKSEYLALVMLFSLILSLHASKLVKLVSDKGKMIKSQVSEKQMCSLEKRKPKCKMIPQNIWLV